MKSHRIKKGIAAMTMVSVLSMWSAMPNAAYAKSITIEGKTINTSLTGGAGSVTATISYTQGPKSVSASVTGYACDKNHPEKTTSVSASDGPNATPGGASAGVSAPSGYRFYAANSSCGYTVIINGTTYEGTITDSLNL